MGTSLSVNIAETFARFFDSGNKTPDHSGNDRSSTPSGDASKSSNGKVSPFEGKHVMQDLKSIEGELKDIVKILDKKSSGNSKTPGSDDANSPSDMSSEKFKRPSPSPYQPLPSSDPTPTTSAGSKTSPDQPTSPGKKTASRSDDPSRSANDPSPTSKNLSEAQADTDPKLKPVLRGDEQQLDGEVTNEHQFGQMVDRVAKDYGLDPAMFRAQLQAESGAFNGPDGWKNAMSFEGDTDRGGNYSKGVGQTSEDFLNNGIWAPGGPGSPQLGNQDVTSNEFNGSIVTQLRMAAAMDAKHISDNGGDVAKGLATYVNGSPDTSNPKAAEYLANISKYMNDSSVENA